ncbi:peptidylprolyl isomerase [Rhodococcus phenolicus]|uniref:peptidylprolyl isomerase n=1 Tax=Rhodococcus phenolicus TaxID=263849 RepID=UPI001FE127AD|nr:peptidylprolyl isomerase [Rhodococcus phenolicus]
MAVTPDSSPVPARDRTRRGFVLRGLVLLVAAVLATGCTADSGAATEPPATTVASTTSAPVPGPDAFDPSAYPPLPPVPAPAGATVECRYTEGGPATPQARFSRVATVSTVGTVELTLETTVGPIPLVLDRAKAPCTVNSFINLARQGFYNRSTCDQLVDEPGTQLFTCGDPTGTGTGGPGYRFPDEYPVTVTSHVNGFLTPVLHPRGTLAMASDGRADSNGSRFLLVFGDSVMPAQYTIFGTIGESALPLLDAAAEAGHEGGPGSFGRGRPLTPIMINRVI